MVQIAQNPTQDENPAAQAAGAAAGAALGPIGAIAATVGGIAAVLKGVEIEAGKTPYYTEKARSEGLIA